MNHRILNIVLAALLVVTAVVSGLALRSVRAELVAAQRQTRDALAVAEDAQTQADAATVIAELLQDELVRERQR